MALDRSSLGTDSDLKRFTLAQLRLLCKERRISGYSKLAKASVITKLLDWEKQQGIIQQRARHEVVLVQDQPAIRNEGGDCTSQTSGSSSATLVQPEPCAAVKHPVSSDVGYIVHFKPVPHIRNIQSSSTPPSQQISEGEIEHIRPKVPLVQIHGHIQGLSAGSAGPKASTSSVSSKRACTSQSTGLTTEPLTKKARNTRSSPIYPGISSTKSKAAKFPAMGSVSELDRDAGISRDVYLLKKRKFKAPVFKASPADAKATAFTSNTRPCDILSGYLDFAVEGSFPPLQPISLPPVIAQRRHVSRLSLILSLCISLQDLKACALVSRLFRYSAYMAAYHRLTRQFQGSRLKTLLSGYPEQVTNFWPYLCYRINERDKRKSVYESSFIRLALKGTHNISDYIWTSPDHHKQAIIAVRFSLTKVFFDVSLKCQSQSKTIESPLISKVEEVIPDEIWRVSVQSTSTTRTFYVVEATCEVIGQCLEEHPGHSSYTCGLRLDWGNYIETRLSTSERSDDRSGVRLGLLEHLQWTNHEEYAKGISKHWLARLMKEGDAGMAKLIVAQRYIIACVVKNSISGPRLTANQMQQEFNGIPSLSVGANNNLGRQKCQRINLFLPDHHHVESIHFSLSNGESLHPALAIVQTPAREYYILKDNGMQVGCEEDGLAKVWMSLLGCRNKGTVPILEDGKKR